MIWRFLLGVGVGGEYPLSATISGSLFFFLWFPLIIFSIFFIFIFIIFIFIYFLTLYASKNPTTSPTLSFHSPLYTYCPLPPFVLIGIFLAETSSTLHRGRNTATVFSMQGIGSLLATVV
jgi:hypothetical protein